MSSSGTYLALINSIAQTIAIAGNQAYDDPPYCKYLSTGAGSLALMLTSCRQEGARCLSGYDRLLLRLRLHYVVLPTQREPMEESATKHA